MKRCPWASIIPTNRIEFRTFMGSDGKPQAANRIPIRFPDDEPEEELMENSATQDANSAAAGDASEYDSSNSAEASAKGAEPETGGPVMAELVASRAELKRLQNALADAKDAVVRPQGG